MGTRHLTVVKDIDGKEIMTMYGQWDGYLTGHGKDLKDFLEGFKIVNGISMEDGKLEKVANGMGCLAAQLISHFKIGRIKRGELVRPINSSYRLCPSGTRNCGEEYIYTITLPVDENNWYNVFDRSEVSLNIEVRGGRMTFFGASGTSEENMRVIYSGSVDEFDPCMESKDEN